MTDLKSGISLRRQYDCKVLSLLSFCSGLVESSKYHIAVDIIPKDKYRYRYTYHRSCWTICANGKIYTRQLKKASRCKDGFRGALISVSADVPPKSGLYVHPEGPFTGLQLNQVPISFEKMKLSNSLSGPDGKILMLASMMKYKPRIYLIQGNDLIHRPIRRTTTINVQFFSKSRPFLSKRFQCDKNGES